MNRPDLAGLTEDELRRASSVGLVQRAKKELADASLSAHAWWEDLTIIVQWSDGVTCRFPPGRSLQGDCSCLAGTLCRHLLRSVLWLQANPLPGAEIASVVPATKGRAKAVPAMDELLAMDRVALAKTIGKTLWNKGIRFLQEHPPRVDSAHSRQVSFGGMAITISFPAGSHWEGALCSCRGTMPCPHVVPAIVALRGDVDQIVQEKKEKEPAPDRSSAWRRYHAMIVELMTCGWDGLSMAWCSAAQTTALELEKQGIRQGAKLLERLAGQIGDQRTGDRPFRAELVRRDLAAAWLEWELASSAISVDRSHQREVDLDAGEKPSRRTFVGVGAQAWWTDEHTGLNLLLQDVESGDMVTASTARPRELDLSPSDLARSTILGEVFTARDLLGTMFHCHHENVVDDGKFRGVKENEVELKPDGVDWLMLSQQFGIDGWDRLADRAKKTFPSILTGGRPEIQWLCPARHDLARFDSGRQTLIWPMYDRQGRRIDLEYNYRSERADMIESLEKVSRMSTPMAVLARYRSIESLRTAEPIAMLFFESAGIRLWVIDLQRWDGKPHVRRQTDF
ncbi:hypothetical protein K2X85_09935 [bacterium]|nr:hypothetical protein [bacterium]